MTRDDFTAAMAFEPENKLPETEVTDQEAQPTLDAVAEAKLTRKLDLFLIPILGVLYLLSYLDRGNIGNAKVASPSIMTTLNLTSVQYGAAVSVVYATYVVFEPVWSNLLKIITPRIVLAASTTIWGAITIGTAFAKTYGQLLAIRILLGVFEAGLFPCICVYLFMVYRREEIGRRISYIFCCSALSGAFGGLIAYGLIRIDSGSLFGWQYLYLVEGILSLCAAPLTYFWIPNTMDKAWFLTAEEKEQARIRYEMNKIHYDPAEQFSWRQVGLALTDWKTFASGVIMFGAAVLQYGLGTFMPSIISGMGYSNVNAQLLTVPVYILAALSFLVLARFSDYYRVRSPFMALAFTFTCIGFGILIGVESPKGRYAGLFICALGLYVGGGLNVSWISGNTAGHYKRVSSFGVNQLMGNSAGAAIGTIYSSKLAPRYYRSMYISLGLSGLALVTIIIKAFFLWRINKKREKLCAEGAEDRPELGDRNPHFRFLL